jgi:hypothetical protein
MAESDVTGLEQLRTAARMLKAMGTEGKGLRRELYAGLNRATKPVRADMKASIPSSLPSRGGLADLATKSTSLSTSTRTGVNTVGVRIRVKSKVQQLRRMDKSGEFRHPVYGRRKSRWVTQSAGVNRGFLDDSFDRGKPEAKAAIVESLDAVARKIAAAVNAARGA